MSSFSGKLCILFLTDSPQGLKTAGACTGNTSTVKPGNYGQESCADFCRNPERPGGVYPGATAAYDTWEQKYIDVNAKRSKGVGNLPLMCYCSELTGGRCMLAICSASGYESA